MTSRFQSTSTFSILRMCAVVAAVSGILSWPAPASAQLARLGSSLRALEPGSSMRGTDTAYDPIHDIYLLVAGNGPIYAVFVNSAGVPLTGAFPVMDGSLGWGHFPRAEFSPDVAGGHGGFLVTWHHNVGNANRVFGRLVSIVIPGGLASPIQQISDGAEGGSWWETGPAVAYSRTSRRFLVAWRTLAYGVSGRFVDAYGAPTGGVMPLAPPAPGTGTRDPALAWNPLTDDFGLATTGWGAAGAMASFRRVRAADGYIWGRADFGFSKGTFASAVDVNTWTNNYVVAWSVHPGTMTATLDSNGNLLSTNLVTGRLGFDQSLALAFNPASWTFLAVSSDLDTLEIGGVEVTGSGAPNSTAQIVTDGARLGSYYPMATGRAGIGKQWSVVYSRDFRGATSQIVTTSTVGGLGGGYPPPPPPPPPTGCSTPDPFVSIGGGRCVNAGWLPGGGGGAPPPPPPLPPPPPPTTCTTPDPFVSIGGGSCVNGGWVPRTSSCTTPDPFVSIGGGVCQNGGWVPRTTSQSSCATPDPFVSLGGGVCVDGGWRPR